MRQSRNGDSRVVGGKERALQGLLAEYDIDYREFCSLTGYKGTPRKLLGSLRSYERRAADKALYYYDATGRGR